MTREEANREIGNFLKWCKGRFGLDDETGEMYESEYGETWDFETVIAEYRDEMKQSLGESEETNDKNHS